MKQKNDSGWLAQVKLAEKYLLLQRTYESAMKVSNEAVNTIVDRTSVSVEQQQCFDNDILAIQEGLSDIKNYIAAHVSVAALEQAQENVRIFGDEGDPAADSDDNLPW